MKKFLIFLFCVFLYFSLLFLPAPSNLGKRLDKLEWVKLGGCGYVSYYISNYLDSAHIEYKIIQIGFVNGRYRNIHYMVKVGDVYLDKSGGFSRLHPLLFLPHREISKSELRLLLNDPSIWNKKFNRSDTIHINQILNK